MLFIDSHCRGLGYGSMLLEFAGCQGAVEVDVNEQNPSALAFYRANGFKIKCRDETDEALSQMKNSGSLRRANTVVKILPMSL
ncbi:MAG: GNAT family N-acetyltransferase [Duncaniella sp.]|uniref:GNAT family N-acetyltransferase n=1 Tax=Duncaniella sp. TaxID=2518496 RepID=UPI0023CF27CE|nr:GNAT family N-acetyltransferase [Duncaniella sp.]